MRTFYRIETLDMDEGGIPVCGYMATVQTMLSLKLGIRPDYTAEELQQALNDKKNDEDVRALYGALALLSDIPIPERYKEDQGNLYCLYTKDEFEEAAEILNGLKDIQIELVPQYSFRYKKFKLSEKEILYEDEFQVVITKEVYDKHINDSKYSFI